jgi:proteasome assembly chaperone (PAC2) family protein
MSGTFELWQKPTAKKIFMLAGWRQWADAGAISSGLPQHIIELTGAEKIGQIKPDDFYLFQVPGTHHLLRPTIKLQQGYRQSLTHPTNEFFYTENETTGLVIFLGTEPHLNANQYCAALFDIVEMLNIQRVATVGGVYGAMPYHKDREISCLYSVPALKDELAQYAVKFSDYEGGATIGAYLVDRAEARGLEVIDFYGFVPAYDFTRLSIPLSGIRLENDYKAWYDIARRINHMFDLGLDLTGLQQQGHQLITSIDAKIEELEKNIPQVNVREYIRELSRNFKELSFMPLDDVWKQELGDIFGTMDEQDN